MSIGLLRVLDVGIGGVREVLRGRRGCGPGFECDLGPDARSAHSDAFYAPALAEHLHDVQSEASAAVAVRWTWSDRVVSAGVLDFETDNAVREVDPEDEFR